MKKTLLLLAFVFVVFSTFGQTTIPNGDFETWTTVTNDWHLTNYRYMSKPHPNVTKYQPAYSGNYAVKFETVEIDGELEPGVALGTWNPNPGLGIGGVPYSQKPTKLYAYAQYDLKVGDSATIGVIFKKNGTILGPKGASQNIFKFTGSNTSGYKKLEFDITGLTVTPDSLVLMVLGFNANDMVTDIPTYKLGSYVIFDKISFDTSDPIPYGDFEEWGRPIEYADSWNVWGGYEVTLDCNVTNPMKKTTDSHTGNSAMLISTYFNPYGEGNGVIGGGCTGDYIGNDGFGIPCNVKKGYLKGWYKYFPKSQDTASVNLIFFKKGINIGYATQQLYAMSSYSNFTIPFENSEVSDSVIIQIYSSINSLTKNMGSQLFLDDFTITDATTGFNTKSASEFLVSPNPATESITVKGIDDIATVAIIDLNGKIVVNRNVGDGELINVSSLPKGIYIVKILTDKFTDEKKLVIK